ncbi:hypothetical protein LOK49_LG01G00178 [Camellia lanceoleosa]|uniref:Uncharacterized protein n=1 Tax=Camellia lanceoleosa TaxID=1840588 RepID=A0ACC0IXA4_9ERIC|nr:hypothetical protein LOK49_LG01G00178 [Camellia lanceoleosa]
MMNYVRVMLREKEKEMGAESLMNYAVEKSKELPAVVGDMSGKLMGTAEEKWKELPVMAWTLMDKVDEVFPPETIKEQIQHLIQVSKPYIIPATAAIVLLILLYYCGRLFITIMRSLLSYFGCGTVSGGKVTKMMIAPGTRGALVIVRSVFGSNPSGYFRGLRGK